MVEYDDNGGENGASGKDKGRWKNLQATVRRMRKKIFGGSAKLPEREDERDG